MAYPTPTIYSYRVATLPGVTGSSLPSYWAEFSTNGGSVWRRLNTFVYNSFDEAKNAIGTIVSDESDFRDEFLHGVARVPDPITTSAYP